MCCSSVVPAGICEMIKGVISKTEYKFRSVRYFQACSYAVLYLRVGTLSPHFRKVSVLRQIRSLFNPLNPELNPICYLLALLAHHFLHVSRIRVKSLTLRLLMSYIYMEHLFLMFLDHTQRRSTVGRTPLDE